MGFFEYEVLFHHEVLWQKAIVGINYVLPCFGINGGKGIVIEGCKRFL